MGSSPIVSTAGTQVRAYLIALAAAHGARRAIRVPLLCHVFTKVWGPLGGFLRERRNERDMLRTLERVKAVAEGS